MTHLFSRLQRTAVSAVAVAVGAVLLGPLPPTPAAGEGTQPLIAQQLISFTCNYGDICTIHPDGTNLQVLVVNPGLGLAGPISPDGRKLVYFVDTTGGYDGQLWVMSPDGANQRVVLADPVVNYAAMSWAPDSWRIAYTKAGSSGIAVTNLDGTGNRTILDRPARSPAWSPDGRWIAFEMVGANNVFDLWKMRPDGTGLTRLTTTPYYEREPAWSPDGGRIAYVRQFDLPTPWPRDARFEVWTMRPDGTDVRRLVRTDDSTGGPDGPSYSPDGARIAFSNRPADEPFNRDIFTVKVDGTGIERLTFASPTTFNRQPEWGRALVPGTPVVAVARRRAEEPEGDTTRVFRFHVTLSAASTQPVTVTWHTEDRSAVAGADYVAARGTVRFAAGEVVKVVPVTVLGDSVPEETEWFVVTLDSATGATIATGETAGPTPAGAARGRIRDDD